MSDEELNDKKILTANQMTGELLLRIALYGVIFYVIYKLAYGLCVVFYEDNKNLVPLGFIGLAFQALIVFATFKLANRQAFKKGTINKSDVGKVLKNVSFVIIVILLIQILGTFTSASSLSLNLLPRLCNLVNFYDLQCDFLLYVLRLLFFLLSLDWF